MEGYGSEISVATVPNEGQFRAVDHQSAQKRLFMDRNLDLFLSCSTASREEKTYNIDETLKWNKTWLYPVNS